MCVYVHTRVPAESSFGTLGHSPELGTRPQWKREGECHKLVPIERV